MEVIILLILIVILIMIFRIDNKRSNELYDTSLYQRDIKEQLKELRREIRELKTASSSPVADNSKWAPSAPAAPEPVIPENKPQETVIPEVPYFSTPHETFTNPVPEKPEEPIVINEPVYEETAESVSYFTSDSVAQPTSEAKKEHAPLSPPPTYEPENTSDFWTRFLERNPDLEKFIGENLINKIGIAVLVLGIAFFVKYAIDQNWINEAGRVSIGIFCGAALIGVAHYLRNTYRSFSSVLAGGGIAVFYFTIAFAFHQYHLMPQTAAFGIMVVITAFAVALSVLYNKLELAIIATIGGFVTPFLVSTGDGNYVVLFIYLIILNSGLLSLAYFKKWLPLNITALGFTIIIFGGWLTAKGIPIGTTKVMTHALIFATAFYALFLGMNVINETRNKAKFKPLDFSVLLGINALYFSAGMAITHYLQAGKWQGAFTVWMGIINLALAWFFFKKTAKDKNLLYLLIGLTLTFFTLAVPVQLHGHTITLFWSAEFVLLYWLYQRSQIQLYKLSSALIAVLSFISLLMDWSMAADFNSNLSLIFTNLTGFVTNLVSIGALAAYCYLLRQEEEGAEYLPGIKTKRMVQAAITVAGVITYLTLIFGVNLLCNPHYATYPVPNVYHRLINEVLSIAAIWYLNRKTDRQLLVLRMALIVYCFAFYLFSTSEVLTLRNLTLYGKYPMVHYLVHWLDVGLLITLFYLSIQFIRSTIQLSSSAKQKATWIFSIALLALFSIEGLHLYISALYKPETLAATSYQYGKAGLTILWTVSSFIFIWLGMKHRHKPLRVIALSLFALVLVKLFLFDIRGISEGGKIAAFILLGVLLLTVSFMYQKLKKMLIDDKE